MQKNKLEEILLLLIDNFGILYGRTRLHKLIFLLEEEEHLGSIAAFEKRQYGPYSNEISNTLDRLKEKNVVQEVMDKNSKDKGYYYMINPEKRKQIDEITKSIDKEILIKIGRIVEKFRNLPINQLLKYVYSRYPMWTKSSIWKGSF